MSGGMLIGEAAAAVGLNAKTIRYYEERGLLEGAARSEAGYRVYGEPDLERLRFITGAKTLGLSLGEIKEVLTAWSAGDRPCGRVRGLLIGKLGELEKRIEDLARFRDALRAYIAGVDAQASDDAPCSHIAGVSAGAWQPPGELPQESLSRKCASDKNTGSLRLVPAR